MTIKHSAYLPVMYYRACGIQGNKKKSTARCPQARAKRGTAAALPQCLLGHGKVLGWVACPFARSVDEFTADYMSGRPDRMQPRQEGFACHCRHSGEGSDLSYECCLARPGSRS